MPFRLPNPEIDAALEIVDEWTRSGRSLTTTYVFDSFGQAFDFMIEVAQEADRRQQHPDWRNHDNTVTIQLSTHELGGITDLDLEFALIISAIANKRLQ